MGALVEMGRYTPTAKGRADTPHSSSIREMNTPSRTRSHGSFWVRMPSMISAKSCALGAL
jgi:hypothetical protein